MFVLICDNGRYVARSGSQSSYTNKLENAKIYKSREDADSDRCVENESIVNVSNILPY